MSVPAVQGAGKQSRAAMRRKRKIVTWLGDLAFVAPALALYIVFAVVPFFQGLPAMFWKWNGINPEHEYVGLQNFQTMLKDPNVYNALSVTIQFVLISVVFSNIFGLLFALLFCQASRTNAFCRAAVFLPYVISAVLTSYMFTYLYIYLIEPLTGKPTPLANQDYAIWGVAMMMVWHMIGFCMIIYIAGLNAVPAELYECCKIEGAGPWQTFTRVTLPLIMPSFTINVTLLLANGMRVFEYPWAATSGGPGHSTETIAMIIYRNIFSYRKAGYGQALAFVFTVITLVISVAVSNIFRKREVEM